MIEPGKLMRGVFLALAFVVAGPMSGAALPLLGAGAAAAQAQEQLVASVLFEGNRRFSDEQLLTMVNTATRGTYTAARTQVDVETIRQAYDQAGFNNVQVTARAEPTEGGRVRVTFVVNEGDRAGIAAINFTGNNAVNAGILKGVITTKESGILSFLFRDDIYDEQKLAIDRELIRRYYNNHGFPDAQVSSVGQFDAGRNAYFVNFTVNEGERYTFGNIGVETSISGLDAGSLTNTIETDEGGRYSLEDLQSTSERMAIQATQQGYSFADVRPRIDRDIANRIFNVTYLVDEGPRVYVERINITGNEKTRDFVIRRELDFSEGDPFNRNLVTRGRADILELGFFSAVNVTAEPGSSADKIVINIAVVEQSTGDYGVSFGYSTADGILGEVSLTERNFLGRGQYLRIAVGATQTGKTFDFSFTEPRFMGLDVSAGIDLYSRVTDENSSYFYGSTSTGGQLRFGVPVTENITASVFGGYNRQVISDTNMPFSDIVNDGDVFNRATIGYSLTFNTLDDRNDPTEGFFGTFTQTYAGYDFNFLKTEARGRYFMPVIEDTGIVASVRGQAGIINQLGGGAVPAIEAFNLGPNLVRGFEGRGFGPRLDTGEYLGATAYVGLSAEIEFPLPILPESYGLSGAVWADAAIVGSELPGTGTGTFDTGSMDTPLRASVGASIIWDSPFGPLRGDVAHVLSKSTDDRTQVFQLTLSTLL